MVDQLSKEYLTIPFVFRFNEETEYAPRDSEIARFVTSGHPQHSQCQAHTIFSMNCLKICEQVLDSNNPYNRNHVFAVLAARVSLDPCMNSPESIQLAREAVTSHLRLVVHIDQATGTMATTMLLEPVVSEAAASILRGIQAKSRVLCWVSTIESFTGQLLSRGLVEKGVRRELYARLVLVLARDQLLNKMNLSTQFPYAVPYAVPHFLKTLFSNKHHTAMAEEIPQGRAGTRKARKLEEKTLGAAFEGTLLNFTYFTHTDRLLEPVSMVSLLHGLMHAQAALQLSHNKPYWDLLIPIYLGDKDCPFDTSFLSVILIQVKNPQKREPLLLAEENFPPYFRGDFRQPIPAMLFELGTDEEPSVRPITSFSSTVYGLKVKRAGSEIFGYLGQDDGNLARACDFLLREEKLIDWEYQVRLENNGEIARHWVDWA